MTQFDPNQVLVTQPKTLKYAHKTEKYQLWTFRTVYTHEELQLLMLSTFSS